MKSLKRSFLLLSLFLTAFSALAGCRSAGDDLDLQAAVPTPTNTPTPFPSRTPTLTPTPIPSPTPAPTATPLPPVNAEITGPKTVPPGLPRSVEWRITITNGAELVIASVDDLGGTMLTGDSGGQLVLAKTLLPADVDSGAAGFPSEWVIPGVIDPNIGQGMISFFLETATGSRTVTLPWVTGEGSEVEEQSVALTIDSTSAVIEIDPESATAPGLNGFLSYKSGNGLSFDYPAAWFINESADGIIQLSPDPIPAADGARPAAAAYATLIGGSRDDVGLPAGVPLSANAVLNWLLGDLTTTGGSGAGVFLSDELEVISQEDIELADGEAARQVVLEPLNDDEKELMQVIFLVLTRSEDEIYIISAFDPPAKPITPDLVELLATLAISR